MQSVAATFHAMHKLSTNGYCRHLYRYNMNRHKNNNNHDVHWIARPPYATLRLSTHKHHQLSFQYTHISDVLFRHHGAHRGINVQQQTTFFILDLFNQCTTFGECHCFTLLIAVGKLFDTDQCRFTQFVETKQLLINFDCLLKRL